jgi:hypothetical protein
MEQALLPAPLGRVAGMSTATPIDLGEISRLDPKI